jgi:hypothetical protein
MGQLRIQTLQSGFHLASVLLLPSVSLTSDNCAHLTGSVLERNEVLIIKRTLTLLSSIDWYYYYC